MFDFNTILSQCEKVFPAPSCVDHCASIENPLNRLFCGINSYDACKQQLDSSLPSTVAKRTFCTMGSHPYSSIAYGTLSAFQAYDITRKLIRGSTKEKIFATINTLCLVAIGIASYQYRLDHDNNDLAYASLTGAGLGLVTGLIKG